MKNTASDIYTAAPNNTPCDSVCSMEGCATLFGEVHKIIRITLDELAMLAGIATVDNATVGGSATADKVP
jgi:hypothetical protein